MNENEPVLTAKELLAYRRSTGALTEFPPPRAVIFAPQKSLAAYVLRRYSTKQVKGFLGEFYLLKKFKGEIALSTGFGIGAPVIAGLADEFAALGVKQFAIVGMAGGLQENLSTGSLVLSTGAIRGEGVSRHYLPPADTVESSTDFTQGVSAILTKQNHLHTSGLTWTTDAPFRELRKDVLDYQNRGVLAVDMEAAAMLAVAKSNGLPAIAAFSISDTLSNGVWSMSKDLRPAQLSLSILFESVLEYLMSQ
ncbi:MAG: nucleoside phosphorylase [Anaerolineales bacterium]|nr:nucleoside phosphorylase [Anaerolineales bacterium]